ncbi:hypothetical protein LSH36_823g00045 [Paralvinella palmiformis]|uniref:Uncharacterized protein n=1 Tax=Paralvinella palmiformis TaxID=53620 RepID=A0AAD9J110_9ANNE|nr:hypothetical protein LSH36_823g00045 [Paralvinella palmiformis]
MSADSYLNAAFQKGISLHMIANRHLSPDAEKWPQEQILQELSKVSHVRLDREQITSMDLELFSGSVTNLYLQHVNQLPKCIAILNLKANHCCEEPNYRQEAIQALPRLRQLDEVDVSNKERRAAGLEVSSSEDEEDEEVEIKVQLRESRKGSFGSKASEMLLRSQERMENDLLDHKSRLQILSDIRTETASNIYTKPTN